jgi:ParB family transcriptional regulator, chromosome partitioning protein
MPADASAAKLEQLPVDQIDHNPDNPRLVFRPGELDELLDSIRIHGVQVPVSVYKDGKRYVLIDGERRWRCSLKLNRKTVPALVQPRPDALDNLLLMFNIHSLREQWDLLTIAMKLPKVIGLLENRLGRRATERDIAEQTGLNRSIIRRSKLLMDLPEQYRDQILQELAKPKAQQKLTEDLFIEMERALTTVQRAMPQLIADEPQRDKVRRVLIKKFKNNTISNRVHFRLLAKIARAKNVGYDTTDALAKIGRVFADNDYSIEAAFNESVSGSYKERDLEGKINSLSELLSGLSPEDLDEDTRAKLYALIERAQALLGE